MTTKNVKTLSAAERDYLQAAVRCMMAVEAEACANVPSPATTFADATFLDACKVSRITGICSLHHESAAELLCLLGDAADVEVHVPAVSLADDFEESAIAATVGYEAATPAIVDTGRSIDNSFRF